MVSKDRNLLYFEGTNPILGCTILLSGNRDLEEKELQDVKTALREMLKLARNVVLERAFLDQINSQIPKPINDERGNLLPVNSPFLITKNIKNRSILVLNKVIMKKGVANNNQQGIAPIPSLGNTAPQMSQGVGSNSNNFLQI